MYRVFIKYVFFLKILEYSGLWSFSVSLGVSVCTHTRQVENQRCSSEKSQHFKKKIQYLMNTLYAHHHPLFTICDLSSANWKQRHNVSLSLFIVELTMQGHTGCSLNIVFFLKI